MSFAAERILLNRGIGHASDSSGSSELMAVADHAQQIELKAGSTGLSLSKVGLTVLQVLMALSVGVTYYVTNIEENHSELKAINAAFINIVLNYFFIEIADTLMQMFTTKKTDLEQFLIEANNPLIVRPSYDFKLYKPVVVAFSLFGALCSSMLAFNGGNEARKDSHGWWGEAVEGCNYGNLLVNVCFLYSVDIFHELMAFRLEENQTKIALEGIQDVFEISMRTENPMLKTELSGLLSNDIVFEEGASAALNAEKLRAIFEIIKSNPVLLKCLEGNTRAVFKKDPDRSYGRAIFSGARYLTAKFSWLLVLACAIDSAPGIRGGIETLKVDFKGNEWLALLLYLPEAFFLSNFYQKAAFYAFDRLEALGYRLSGVVQDCGVKSIREVPPLFLGLGIAAVAAGVSASTFLAQVADGKVHSGYSGSYPASSFINLSSDMPDALIVAVIATSSATNFKAIAEPLITFFSRILCVSPSLKIKRLKDASKALSDLNFAFFNQGAAAVAGAGAGVGVGVPDTEETHLLFSPTRAS
ncbi:MAG: hypothetical protein NTV32_04840 [Gammaproteobacteria bacterium]|nr:hypothetical protein [Gammaproteobacteria bacterium]